MRQYNDSKAVNKMAVSKARMNAAKATAKEDAEELRRYRQSLVHKALPEQAVCPAVQN